MIEHRNIRHDGSSVLLKETLQQYYDANKLLVDCMNSDCYVSREVRQEIGETLLLPIAEIQKRSSEDKPRKIFGIIAQPELASFSDYPQPALK
jgi:hypothetical protein